MALLVLDIETFYDPAHPSGSYSLRSMTTLEYVLDPRFKAHGVTFRFLGDVKHPRLPESGWVTHADMPAFFAQIDWSTTAVIGHNLFFDAAILRWHYGVTTCRQWFDTLGMARYVLGAIIPSLSLGSVFEHITGLQGKQKAGVLEETKGVRDLSPEQEARMADYAKDDGYETAVIFENMLSKFPVAEWPKMHWCIDMWLNPKLRLDDQKLQDVIVAEQAKKAALIVATGMSKTAISSNQQFAAALEALGVAVPTKISKTTGKRTYALAKNDQDFAAFLGHPDSRVSKLVEARIAVKSTIDETRAIRLLKVHELTGGWLPVPLNYCGAVQSARLGGAEALNLQNLGRGSMLRDAIVAPDGYVVLAADLSNIELRINMVACGQSDAVEALRRGEDLYCRFGTTLFGRTITKADKMERLVSKISELSLGYSAGSATFAQMHWVQGAGPVTPERAAQIVAVYRASHSAVQATWRALGDWGKAMAVSAPGQPVYQPNYHAPVRFEQDGVVMPSGFKIKYPNIRYEQAKRMDADGNVTLESVLGYTRFGGKSKGSGFSFLTPPVLTENPSQTLAAEILWDMIVRIHARLGIWPALQVHDEIVFVVPEAQADQCRDIILGIMHVAPSWWPELPVAAEGAYGKSYGEAK